MFSFLFDTKQQVLARKHVSSVTRYLQGVSNKFCLLFSEPRMRFCHHLNTLYIILDWQIIHKANNKTTFLLTSQAFYSFAILCCSIKVDHGCYLENGPHLNKIAISIDRASIYLDYIDCIITLERQWNWNEFWMSSDSSDKSLIWTEIKRVAPLINKAGGL